MTARLDKPTVLSSYFLNGDVPDQAAFSKFLYTSLTPQIQSVSSSGGHVTIDASTGDLFRVALGENTIIDAPANPVDGQAVTLWLQQDVAGNRTIDISALVLPSSAVAPVFSTTGDVMDMLAMRWDAANSRWLIISFIKGY